MREMKDKGCYIVCECVCVCVRGCECVRGVVKRRLKFVKAARKMRGVMEFAPFDTTMI